MELFHDCHCHNTHIQDNTPNEEEVAAGHVHDIHVEDTDFFLALEAKLHSQLVCPQVGPLACDLALEEAPIHDHHDSQHFPRHFEIWKLSSKVCQFRQYHLLPIGLDLLEDYGLEIPMSLPIVKAKTHLQGVDDNVVEYLLPPK